MAWVAAGGDDGERQAAGAHLGHRPVEQAAPDTAPLMRGIDSDHLDFADRGGVLLAPADGDEADRVLVDVGDPRINTVGPAHLRHRRAWADRPSGYTRPKVRGPMIVAKLANTGAHASRETATTASTLASAKGRMVTSTPQIEARAAPRVRTSYRMLVVPLGNVYRERRSSEGMYFYDCPRSPVRIGSPGPGRARHTAQDRVSPTRP